MSSGQRPDRGRSFDIHLDPDGTAHVGVRLGDAHLTFQVSREQRAKVWVQMRPAMPYVASIAVTVALGTVFAVVAAAAPPTTA